MRQQVNGLKLSISLEDDAEETKRLTSQKMSLECECLDSPCSYCTTCWKDVCRSCTENHADHTMMPYAPCSIRIVNKASEISKTLDGKAEKLGRKQEINDQAREKALAEKDFSKRELKNIIDDIHKTIAQAQQIIDEEIDAQFNNFVESVKNSEDSIILQKQEIETVKENMMMEKVRPIQNGCIQMTAETKKGIEASLDIIEKILVPSMLKRSNGVDCPLSRFKFVGQDFMHDRVCAAVNDSCASKIKNPKIKVRHSIRSLSLDRQI